MKSHIFIGVASVGIALMVMLGGMFEKTAIAQGQEWVLPIFVVDANFPTMPEHMEMGGVGGVNADSHGNVWVFQRPHTIEDGNSMDNGYKPAPPVLEFDEKGNYIQGWGGPSKTGEYQWTNRGGLHSSYAECASCSDQKRTNGDGRPGSGEHGITVDYKDNVWLTGNGDGDGQILKFTRDGKFLLQIGHAGIRANSNDTVNVSRATTVVVYQKTNEVFVADGYGNRRVIVFDADTGKYKRHWGAYGNMPDDSVPNKRLISGPGAQQFNTVRGIAISNDDLVYVADRGNNRIQMFKPDGTFMKEAYVGRRDTAGTGSAYGVALSGDPQQRFLYVADGSDDHIAILDRNTLETIGQIGRPGRKAGEFFHAHSIATDSKGNILVGESQGYRVQKFIYRGLSTGAAR
jgi:NHL repeat-containing protein